MYTFIIKDSGPDLDIIITRAMLALAAIAAMVYQSEGYYYLNLSLAAALLIAAVFIKLLLVKFRIHKIVLLSVAAVILFIATRSIAFALIFLVYGYLVKFLNRQPVIVITNEGITIKKLFASPVYRWNEFSNIILKDSVLTLDFKNNKLVQVGIDETRAVVDENSFNEYCIGKVGRLIG
ncbi:MAG: hypothetical protein ABI707_20390 [Ferruginibacter sp.]